MINQNNLQHSMFEATIPFHHPYLLFWANLLFITVAVEFVSSRRFAILAGTFSRRQIYNNLNRFLTLLPLLIFASPSRAQISTTNSAALNSTHPGTITFLNLGIQALIVSIPDINGDNLPEILISDQYASPLGRTKAGSTYLIWGSRSFGITVDLADWDNLNIGTRFDGAAPGDSSGVSMAGVDDINGDSLPEILIGASNASPQGRTNAGSAYLIWGNCTLGKIIDLSLWSNLMIGTRFDGYGQYNYNGLALTSVPDINGDNRPDILIRSTGSTYLIWGTSTLGNIVDFASWNFLTIGTRFDNYASANSLASIGDINGDNISEILLGAEDASPLGRQNAGSVYLIWGNRSLGKIVDLGAWTNLTIGIRIDGATAGDYCGHSVTSITDINHDHISEILMGCWLASPQGRHDAGSTYLIWGNRSLGNTVDLAQWSNLNLGTRFDGAVAMDYSGSAIGSAPDINGDTFPEILIGAYGASRYAGSTYLIWGNPLLSNVIDFTIWNNLSIGIRFDGRPFFYTGFSVASMSDIEGDNRAEILIGAGTVAYLILSSALGFAETLSPTTTSTTPPLTSYTTKTNRGCAVTTTPMTLSHTLSSTSPTAYRTTSNPFTPESNSSPMITTINMTNPLTMMNSSFSGLSSILATLSTILVSTFISESLPPSKNNTSTITSSSPTFIDHKTSVITPTASSSNAGVIGGAVAGSVMVALLAGVGIYACRRKRRPPLMPDAQLQSLSGANHGISNNKMEEESMKSARLEPDNEYANLSQIPKPSHYENVIMAVPIDNYAANKSQWLSAREMEEDFAQRNTTGPAKPDGNYINLSTKQLGVGPRS